MKNNYPSSEFEAKDRCPSCGAYCNIHTDLDDNDECNECRTNTQNLFKISNNIVPTAEEFYDKSKHDSILDIMIEFAKLHVQEALKEASEKADPKWSRNEDYSLNFLGIDKDSILNSYPLTNIK